MKNHSYAYFKCEGSVYMMDNDANVYHETGSEDESKSLQKTAKRVKSGDYIP